MDQNSLDKAHLNHRCVRSLTEAVPDEPLITPQFNLF